MYQQWTQGVSDDQKGLVAFLHGAVWPDCIKRNDCSPGYSPDGGDTPPGRPTDAQNIGYSDKLMHKYWHFLDIPYEAGAPGEAPKTPNALTEILLLSQAIRTGETDDVKSYDIVWLEHLGDVHQPLHSTSRFTKNHPSEDAGGNFVAFCKKPCKDELHAYWDGLLGDTPSIGEVTKTGQGLLANGPPKGSDNADPHSWVDDSFVLAKTVVYVSPISADNDLSAPISPRPNVPYETKASEIALDRSGQWQLLRASSPVVADRNRGSRRTLEGKLERHADGARCLRGQA